jgi:hypothetical protein
LLLLPQQLLLVQQSEAGCQELLPSFFVLTEFQACGVLPALDASMLSESAAFAPKAALKLPCCFKSVDIPLL